MKKIIGLGELDVLYRCEKLSKGLFRHLCGLELPMELNNRQVLRSFAHVVRDHRIRVVETPSLNDEATVNQLRRDAPDVIIGLGTRILSSEVLATARIGVLNAHSSLLPEYRGGTTEFWQLVGGESHTGVTIHWMSERVDEGKICAQRSWPIPRGSDHHQLRMMSLFYRLELWRDVIERILNGEVPRREQTASRTPTFRHPTLRQQYDFYCRR